MPVSSLSPLRGDSFLARLLAPAKGLTLKALGCMASLGIAVHSAHAQALYWDTNSTAAGTNAVSTSTWDTTTANWSTDGTGVAAPGVWTDGNLANFSAGTNGTGIQTITASGTLDPTGITIDEGTVNISGGTLDLGGDIVTVAAGTSSISSVISGSGTFTKAGTGTLVISGNNTFTGTVTTGAGVLRATGNANALGTGAATVNLNGGTLWLANDNDLSFNRATTVSAATTVTLGRSTAGTGAQTFTMGTLSIGGQTLTVNADNPTLTGTNSAATLAFGATTLTANATISVTNPTVSGGNTTVRLGALSDGGNNYTLTKTGTGRLTLTAASPLYTGKLIVTGGLVSVGSEANLGASLDPDIAIADQITLNGGGLEASVTMALSKSRGITLGAGHGVLDVNSGQILTVAGVISGTGNLTKADSGSLILGVNNTYTGTTIVTGGILRVDQNIASGGSTPGQLGISSAAIQVASASLVTSGAYTIDRGVQVNASGATTTLGTQATSGTTVFNGNITNNNAGNSQQLNLSAPGTSRVEFRGTISGNSSANSDGDSSVYTSGTGTVALAGNNTYRGYTQVSANTTLVAQHNNALGTGTGSFGTGVVGGGSLELQGGITTPEEIIINGTGVTGSGALKSTSGNNTVNGPVILGSASTVTSAAAGQTLTLAGSVKADYGLTVNGAGNTTISGVLSGQTGYVAGLREGRITAGSSFNTSTVNVGGAQVLSAIAGYNNDKTVAGKWGDNETWVYTGQFFDADGVFSFAENIDDSVQVIVDGKVILQNSGYNIVTNSGVANGETNAGASSPNANGAPAGNIGTNLGMGANGDGWHTIEVRFGNGGGGAGPVVSTNQHWTATKGFGYSAAGSVLYDGDFFSVLADDGSGSLLRTLTSNSLTKTGTGILTLSNANTYAGPTLITQGTLLVTNLTGSGTGTSTVTAASGGSLGGTGRIAGSTVISVGGKLILGSDAAAVGSDFGIGTLSFDSDLTVSGTINFDLASSTVFDKLSVGGLLSLNADTVININPLGFTPDGTEVFDLIDAGSFAMNGFNPNSLTDLILPTLAAGYQWDTSRFGTEGILAITVPEPSRALLLLGGILALALRRRTGFAGDTRLEDERQKT